MFSKIKIARDVNKSHLTIKDQDFPLVMLRPYDLVQLGALVASGSEDILKWTGKNIGKNIVNIIQNLLKKKNKREKIIEATLATLENFGYGHLSFEYNNGTLIRIKVSNPISKEIKDKEDAKVLCNLYNGIFIGLLNGTGLDVDGDEIQCSLDGYTECVFEYKPEEEI